MTFGFLSLPWQTYDLEGPMATHWGQDIEAWIALFYGKDNVDKDSCVTFSRVSEGVSRKCVFQTFTIRYLD
jgi:hypothetical protein